nr:MAG TPA: hypothetical protein [Caudoviricetes sp.]
MRPSLYIQFHLRPSFTKNFPSFISPHKGLRSKSLGLLFFLNNSIFHLYSIKVIRRINIFLLRRIFIIFMEVQLGGTYDDQHSTEERIPADGQ